MGDTRPPTQTGPERSTLMALYRFQRDSVVRKVTGVSDVDAQRRMVPSETTLLWLVNHLAYAETLWYVERFLGEPSDLSPDADTVAGAVARYRAACERSDAIIAAADFDAECRNVGDRAPVNLRWVVMHMLEETARHAGHADILRELIDGETGR